MTYLIKEEYWSKWGEDVNAETVVTDAEVKRLAAEWGVEVDDLMGQLEECPGYLCRQWTKTALDGWNMEKDWCPTEEAAHRLGRIHVENLRYDELEREYDVIPVVE